MSVASNSELSTKRTASFEIMYEHHLDSDSEEEIESLIPTEDALEAEIHEGPSNEKLLGTAFVSFFSFASLQSVIAYISGSQALMGDSAAMLVDALAYGFNWMAERRKMSYTPHPTESPRVQQRNLRKTTLLWELVPATISITTLGIVSGVVLKDAIIVLVLDAKRSAADQSTPNVDLMMAFACFNLVLDIVNVSCFASANHALGYATMTEDIVDQANDPHMDSNHERIRQHSGSSANNFNSEGDLELTSGDYADEDQHPENGCESVQDSQTNLNMCSAYTHVFADTLRSLAVILSAAASMLFEVVTPEVADATAAVVVSILIGLSVIPLFQGLWHAFVEYRAICYEEQNEGLLQESDS